MRQLGKSRRALSSVITGAILLTATVVMGTGLVSWANSELTTYQETISNAFVTNVNKLSENLVIENVWFGSNPSKFLNVTITNTGTEGANVTDIRLVSSSQTSDFPFQHGAIISNHQNSTVIYYNWHSKLPIQVSVTTSRGSIFTGQVMPP
jgi:archaellum component FlaF (FlaF/FlaG flagellin family)